MWSLGRAASRRASVGWFRRRWASSSGSGSAVASPQSGSEVLREALGSLTSGQLSEVLGASGVDYRDVYEKRDLVERVWEEVRGNRLNGRASRLLEVAVKGGGRAFEPRFESLLPHERTTVELFKRSVPSVVHVATLKASVQPFSLEVAQVPAGAGSGFVWDADGHVVTNYHVVRSGKEVVGRPEFGARAQVVDVEQRVVVTLSDGSRWDAPVVGAYPEADLAVLRIGAPVAQGVLPSHTPGGRQGFASSVEQRRGERVPAGSVLGLRPIAVGHSDDLLVGQSVLAIGNPFGLDFTLTQGVVSAVGRGIQSVAGTPIRGVIQTDAAVNPGNSGGPLLDSQGQLIGVNTAILSPSGASAGVGFAVPVDTVKRVVSQLIRHGSYRPPALGVLPAPRELQGRLVASRQLPADPAAAGVLVLDVVPDGGAVRGGIRGTRTDGQTGALLLGDIITHVASSPVGDSDETLRALVESQSPGDTVNVTVLRWEPAASAFAKLNLRVKLS